MAKRPGEATMSRIKSLLFLLVLAAQVPLASAAVTYAVGSCKPGLSSFPTIMRALEAIPAPNVVQVCPGTYAEQVVITNPVTLEGISASNSATGPTITAPTGGLVANAADDFGAALAVQIWIENAPGEVNLTNLTVDGINNNVGNEAPYNVGVFYQNSPGTANRLFVVNQSGNLRGYGIWLEGGSANPSVTVENSLVANFDWVGIYAKPIPAHPNSPRRLRPTICRVASNPSPRQALQRALNFSRG